MNIKEFLNLYESKNTKNLTHIVSDNTLSTFEKNRTTILNSYFEDVFRKIKEHKFDDLQEHQSIFLIHPFKKNDGNQFLQIIKNINKLIENKPSVINSNLLGFEWLILDYILHEYLIEDIESDFKNELLILKKSLSAIIGLDDEVSLLLQKIEHFGIKQRSI